MGMITIFFSIILSIFSTAVLSYISMATGIGPWIDPTIALITMPLFKLFSSHDNNNKSIGLITSAGSIGGILATGMGFSLPTLYFLDPQLFNSWLSSPLYFVAVLASLAFVAGGFGLWIANVLEHKMIVQEKLAFPVGELVYKMISVQNQAKKAWELFIGFITTFIFCIFQSDIASWTGFIPKSILLSPTFNLFAMNIPAIRFDMMPMLWAIGFVTGHVIAIPLAIGAFSRILIIDTLNQYHLFNHISSTEFVLAFCSGMILAGTFSSFIKLPQLLWNSLKKLSAKILNYKNSSIASAGSISTKHIIQLLILLPLLTIFFLYFNFSLLLLLYLLVTTYMCTYEIADQAGKIGLARLGMFATFVMVPAIFLFNLNFVQIVLIATFVEICGGVAADILFNRKLAHNAEISVDKMEKYQWLGLLIASLSVGIIFWALINHFSLGSPELFAYKAKNRQLLIGAREFNLSVLAFGMCFGYILKELKVNASLVLGGILMPISISLGLILGGLLTIFTKSRDEWYPFWSGVFASQSVWMLLEAIIKIIR